MENHRQNGSSRVVFIIIAFSLICGGILLALPLVSNESDTGGLPAGPSSAAELGPACPSEVTREALREAAQADLALREENFGAAQLHIQRARLRLESALAAMDEPGGSTQY